MVDARTRSRGSSGGHGLRLLGVVIGVAVTLSYTWKKVELANAVQGIAQARLETGSALEKRTQLASSIADRTRPAAIKAIAVSQLGMSYPSSRNVNFVQVD